MRAGHAIRQARAAEATCADCGHLLTEHRERSYGAEDYAPLVFHCAECDCVVVR